MAWSHGSTKVLAHRTDERSVRQTHLVESRPADGGAPLLRTQRYAYPGDEQVPHAELVVLDVQAGTMVRAQAEPLLMTQFSPIMIKWAWWAPDGSAVYYLSQPRDLHTLTLHRLEPATGEVTTVLSETGATRVEPNQWMTEPPIVRVLADEVLWYSQRDDWGHLYRYDLRTGALLGQVTSGQWAVRQILRVDEAERVVYFTASGLVEEDPYRRTVCRANLDGTGFAKVTDDELDHIVTMPDNQEYFIDSASTVDTPPVSRVRDWAGRVLVELERADISKLTATGWTPPERFRVKAADGVTDIYGVLYRPRGFDPAQRYPVVDSVYPGPQVNRVAPSFDPGGMGLDAEPIAALGFVVVAVDGRGTPGRSKSFHDASYGHLADAGCLADHVAALRQLAQARPWMDLDRVGAFGHSGGGFAAARAMLDFPEVYKTGVALSGNHDDRYFNLGFVEAYDGADNPEAWARASNVDIADRLAGKLLLIHGGMDDQVPPGPHAAAGRPAHRRQPRARLAFRCDGFSGRARRGRGVDGDQAVDDAGALADLPPQLPAARGARGGDLLEADGGGRQVRADRPGEEAVTVEDADIGKVTGIVADGHRLADVGGQDRVEVAQSLEVDAVRVDLAGFRDGEQQQVELFRGLGQAGQEPAGFPAGLRRLAGLTVDAVVIDLDDELPERRIQLGQGQPGLPGAVPGAARGVARQGRQAHLVDRVQVAFDLPPAAWGLTGQGEHQPHAQVGGGLLQVPGGEVRAVVGVEH